MYKEKPATCVVCRVRHDALFAHCKAAATFLSYTKWALYMLFTHSSFLNSSPSLAAESLRREDV